MGKTNVILEFKAVGKLYDKETRALKDINFTVEEGEFISIIGPSGAGKSTLLRCVNRLVNTSEGSIVLDGTDITKVKGKELRNIRTKTGMIFQHYNLVDRLSVVENVLHGLMGKKNAISGMLGLYTEEEKKITLLRVLQEGMNWRKMIEEWIVEN